MTITDIPRRNWIDFRSWHAEAVHDTLVAFRQNANGVPGRFAFDEAGNEIDDAEAQANWTKALDDLIESWYLVFAMDDEMLSAEAEQKRVNEAMRQLADLYLCLWD
jgi:hypothetical protein